MFGKSIGPKSFMAKPKTLYRVGQKLARLEESPDLKLNLHGLVIINEPDTWMINLADRTGQHSKDPGPPVFSAPVFQEKNAPAIFNILEFGREHEFFVANRARSLGSRRIDDEDCDVLEVKAEDWSVDLLTSKKTKKPYQVDVIGPNALSYSIRYDSYELNLPFKEELFHPPEGIRIHEAEEK